MPEREQAAGIKRHDESYSRPPRSSERFADIASRRSETFALEQRPIIKKGRPRLGIHSQKMRGCPVAASLTFAAEAMMANVLKSKSR